MEFNNFHKSYFRAINGAFSRVTEREFFDSQITLTDIEADIVINHFGPENIQIGGVYGDREKARKPFLLYPSLTTVNLNLVFPKSQKSELRLYLSSTKGFKPAANQIWFIFEDERKQLIIGAVDEKIWNSLGQEDPIDEIYQLEIEESLIKFPINDNALREGRIIEVEIGSRKTYKRDPKLAILRFNEARYKCENNPLHETFIAESTKLPYVEAHHFIPIKFQPLFHIPLDNFNNIIALCPNCHRAIHHGVIRHKYELISNLYYKRPEINTFALDYIAQFYNCLEFPNEE